MTNREHAAAPGGPREASSGARPEPAPRDTRVPGFVTLGLGVPALIAATTVVDIANWPMPRAALVVAAAAALCCIAADPFIAAFLGLVSWFLVDGFVQDTDAVIRLHPQDLWLIALCVATTTAVALISAGWRLMSAHRNWTAPPEPVDGRRSGHG